MTGEPHSADAGAPGGYEGRPMSDCILVTGARKGLGRAAAEHYLALGWRVAGCSRSPSDLDHEHYRHFEVDVGDERAVVGMVRAIVRHSGPLKAVVNNAGVASMNALLLTPGATVDKLLRTNTIGTFHVLREAAKAMSRTGGGRIVNVTTVAAPLNLEGEAAYAMSKAAVESLTRVAARELADYGVTVNAVGPTPVDTDLIKTVPRAKIDELLQRQAIKRKGTVADVLNVIDFYLQPSSSFITGQVIYLGGVS